HCGVGTVWLCDDPEANLISIVVGRQKSTAHAQCKIVRFTLCLADQTPVAIAMPLQGNANIDWIQLQRSCGSDKDRTSLHNLRRFKCVYHLDLPLFRPVLAILADDPSFMACAPA